MSWNKASVGARFRPPPRHCGNNKNLSVPETGLCGTPCAAVASVYSALLTSHDSQLYAARRSSVSQSVGLGSQPRIPVLLVHCGSVWMPPSDTFALFWPRALTWS